MLPLLPWLARWLLRQPMLWCLQATCTLGLLAGTTLTPLHWSNPTGVASKQLASWALPWALGAVLLAWWGLRLLGVIRQRLGAAQDLALVVAGVGVGVGLGLAPWVVQVVLLLDGEETIAPVASALGALAPLLGPAIALPWASSSKASILAGLIGILGVWVLIPASPADAILGPAWLAWTSGWLLLGWGFRTTLRN